MKRVYEAPVLEIEIYQLDANIASNCTVVVNMGDEGGSTGQPACDDYLGMVGRTRSNISSYAYNVNFWESTCDCYTTAGGPGFFTS